MLDTSRARLRHALGASSAHLRRVPATSLARPGHVPGTPWVRKPVIVVIWLLFRGRNVGILQPDAIRIRKTSFPIVFYHVRRKTSPFCSQTLSKLVKPHLFIGFSTVFDKQKVGSREVRGDIGEVVGGVVGGSWWIRRQDHQNAVFSLVLVLFATSRK